MATVTLKPAPGLKIRVPERGMRHLAESGEPVALNPYWRARLRDGDVTEVKTAAKPAKQQKD